MTQKRIHVPIDNFEQVTSSSKGTVTSNWHPNFGWDRKQEIEAARQEALEAQRKEAEEQQPWNLRLIALEGEVMRLKSAVKELTDAKE